MKNFQHKLFDEMYFYEKLSSTSKQAVKMIKNETAQGNFLVVAEEQSSGMGRNKNSWSSPVGGIWMTAGLYSLSVSSNLTIFTGICIHKALSELYPTITNELKIKWPNDIFWKNKKLCGILSNHLSFSKYHLLGIGLNSNIGAFSPGIEDIAVSLSEILNQELDNKQIISKIFDNFAADFPDFIENSFDLKYFNFHFLLKGKEIVLDTDFDKYSGLCKGINKNGAILIELKPGMIQPFYAGSVVSWK